MAQGPTYRVKFRRRREGKTNYYRRRRLLLSHLPRLVIRKTNTRVIVQIITAHVIGDQTVASAISSELANFGWEAGTANLPAAYLTGLLAGLRAKARGIDRVILDIGLHPPIRGSKIYAALKGALDAQLDIPHDPEILPPEERIMGQHIVAAFKHFSENPNTSHQFSKLGKKKTTLTNLPKKFETVKQLILKIPKSELKRKKKAKARPTKVTPKKSTRPKKKEKPETRAPRAIPRKPKPKKLIARRGKKGKKEK